MGNLPRDYRDNPRQLGSVKDLRTNYPRYLAVPGRQLDIGFFPDLAKRIEAFPAADGACKRLFCQSCSFAGDFRHQKPDSMIVDLLVIETTIIWSNGTHAKEGADILGKASKG
jgi:hypothetical protein